MAPVHVLARLHSVSQPLRLLIAIGSAGLVLAALAAILASPAEAQSALVNSLALRVTVRRETALLEVATERLVRSGDTIRTNSTGRGIVTYRDGSTVLLDVDSELVIELIGAQDGDIVVRMRQTLGRAWYSVSRALSAGSRYEVRSAAMASVIRAGSGSFVAVGGDGETTIVATAGSVEADASGVRVTLPAGTTTRAAVGSAPSSPAPGVAPTPVPAGQSTPRPTASLTATPTPTPEPPQRSASGGAPAATRRSRALSTPRVTPAPVPVGTPTATPAPTHGILPTATPSPSATLLPTKTLLPTATPLRSPTPLPSPTPLSSPTPLPSVLPTPSLPLPSLATGL